MVSSPAKPSSRSVSAARRPASEALIETAAPFPPEPATVDQPASRTPVPSDVPDPKVLSHGPTVALTGYLPDRRLTLRHWGG
jgi:hypothetical protein